MEVLNKKKKVLLGMSGGVDSSAAAIILKNQGYEVIGATLNLCENLPNANQTEIDAKKVCNTLGIEHHVIDGKAQFKTHVIDYFIKEYSNCRTPNPCIECNKYLKFGYLYDIAKELGADYLATGHYAKMEYDETYKKYVIKKADNLKKDQSYVLYQMPKELLGKVLFPLGNISSKEEIRKIAKDSGLDVANKPDSEDICFIPDGNYKDFLEKNSTIKPKEGNIVNKQGEVLGKHQGLYKYTIGQRKGLGVSYKEPLFVIGFNVEKNDLIVGTEKEIYKSQMFVNELNFPLIDKLESSMNVMVKTRYSSKEYLATIEPEADGGTVKVIFDEQVSRITAGQSAVFYIGDILVGGGKIFK